MINTKSGLLVAGLLALGIGGTVLVLRNYYRVPMQSASSSSDVADMTPAEAGPFAADRFTEIRRTYVANLRVYRQCTLAPASPNPAEAGTSLRQPLLEAMKSGPQNQALLASLSQQEQDLLVDAAARALARAAGMSLDEYKRTLDPRDGQTVPGNILDTDLPAGTALPAAGQPPSAVAQLFEKLYTASVASPSDASRVVAWSLKPDGLRVAVGRTAASESPGSMLVGRLDEKDQKLFRGLIVRGSYMFHTSETGMSAGDSSKLLTRAEMAIIVEDGHGDRYPLIIGFVHDADRHQWLNIGVFRTVSVRAAREIPLVY